MRYLIAYDIAAPSRLYQVARFLEKHALRCQKSVFLADVSERELVSILDHLATRIHPEEDCVQAWRLAGGQATEGVIRGIAQPIRPAAIVRDSVRALFVREIDL